MKKNLLLIQFGKWPILGEVKTRLARTLGDQQAFLIHLSLSESVMQNLQSFSSGDYEFWFDRLYDKKSLHYTACLPLMEKLQMMDSRICQQKGKDLGDRMYFAINQSLTEYSKVIIVGSDCPTVDSRYLTQAVDALNDHDLVLGPSNDGGYVLIGARRISPKLFENTRWGTRSVLRAMVNRAEEMKFSVQLLDETWDVDDEADYKRWLIFHKGS